jgi:serine/threonine protein kinase
MVDEYVLLTADEVEYLQSQEYMKSRSNIKSEYLTNVVATASHVDSSWCSKYYKTLVAMEYSEENLAEELHRRRRLTRDDPGKWMSEPEMWYVLRAVTNGSAALASHGLLHGDIQPRNILIMPDETVSRNLRRSSCSRPHC